jgi:hypothetical protein
LERLVCVRLAVAKEEEDEGTIGPRDDDDNGAIVVGGSVAYVEFGPRDDCNELGMKA